MSCIVVSSTILLVWFFILRLQYYSFGFLYFSEADLHNISNGSRPLTSTASLTLVLSTPMTDTDGSGGEFSSVMRSSDGGSPSVRERGRAGGREGEGGQRGRKMHHYITLAERSRPIGVLSLQIVPFNTNTGRITTSKGSCYYTTVITTTITSLIV